MSVRYFLADLSRTEDLSWEMPTEESVVRTTVNLTPSVVVQTPWMEARTRVVHDGNTRVKWLDLRCSNLSAEEHRAIESFEKFIQNSAKENALDWFKRRLEMEQCQAMYRPWLRRGSISMRIPRPMAVQNNRGESLPWSTLAELPSMSCVRVIVENMGVWISHAAFGCIWEVREIMVQERHTLTLPPMFLSASYSEEEEEEEDAISLPQASAVDEMAELHDAPRELMDPITLTLLRDPVTTSMGQVYERASIEKWFESHNTDPLTNLQLEDLTLTPHRDLAERIEEFLADKRTPSGT